MCLCILCVGCFDGVDYLLVYCYVVWQYCVDLVGEFGCCVVVVGNVWIVGQYCVVIGFWVVDCYFQVCWWLVWYVVYVVWCWFVVFVYVCVQQGEVVGVVWLYEIVDFIVVVVDCVWWCVDQVYVVQFELVDVVEVGVVVYVGYVVVYVVGLFVFGYQVFGGVVYGIEVGLVGFVVCFVQYFVGDFVEVGGDQYVEVWVGWMFVVVFFGDEVVVDQVVFGGVVVLDYVYCDMVIGEQQIVVGYE